MKAESRNIKAAPFCWQAKQSLRVIREAFDESTFLDQALAVYLTHSELASDEQTATYTATRRKIAERSGVSITRVRVINEKLRALKLLDWKQNKIEGTCELSANTYTMLGTAYPTLGTPRPRLGTNSNSTPCPVVEESIEESPEESIEGTDSAFKKPNLETVKFHAAKIGLPDIEAEKFFNYYTSNGWKVGKNPMLSLPHALAGWKNRWQERTQRPARTPKPAPTAF